jgi:hypothetical protein
MVGVLVRVAVLVRVGVFEAVGVLEAVGVRDGVRLGVLVGAETETLPPTVHEPSKVNETLKLPSRPRFDGTLPNCTCQVPVAPVPRVSALPGLALVGELSSFPP